MNTTSSRNIDLIDRYLQAVRFWLPKTNRQEDLLAELGEDLRSQIDDKETELGHPLDKAEMAAILKRCGSPMMVAGRLGPQRQLIGPALFPIYEFVLKMVLLWILVPVFVFIVGPGESGRQGVGDWGSAVLQHFRRPMVRAVHRGWNHHSGICHHRAHQRASRSRVQMGPA